MSLRGGLVQRGLRVVALGLAALAVAISVTSDADARTRRRARAESYSPPQASIVIDANSGAVLHASNADSARHPASLTKIMTLYMLFERLESGKLKLSSELPVSAHAAAQAPSKLGLKPGDTIRVDSAIRAIVTKSANDVAVVVAEAVGGDEPSFARMMTTKAHAIGMMHTSYFNASGLPEDRQITTARDQSLLARAMRDRFPQYYHYFSTRSFEYHGNVMRNHNRLLGSVAGLDGMKTGYIRASGFNIVTTVQRGHKYIVAVVFGGKTGKARDALAANLIERTIKTASTRHTAPAIREAVQTALVRARPARAELSGGTPAASVQNSREDVAMTVRQPEPGSTAPINPRAVKTVAVQPGAVHTAALSPLPSETRALAPSPKSATSVTTVATVKRDPPPQPPSGARPGVLGVLPASAAKVASAGESVPATAPKKSEPPARSRGGWMIQVGAFDQEKEAKSRLDACQSKAKDLLGQADPFTERIKKGSKSLYRARFAGLEKQQAEAACKSLKRSDIPCILLKN